MQFQAVFNIPCCIRTSNRAKDLSIQYPYDTIPMYLFGPYAIVQLPYRSVPPKFKKLSKTAFEAISAVYSFADVGRNNYKRRGSPAYAILAFMVLIKLQHLAGLRMAMVSFLPQEV